MQHDKNNSGLLESMHGFHFCYTKKNGYIVGSDSSGMWRLILVPHLLKTCAIMIPSFIEDILFADRVACESLAVMICCVIFR